MSRMSGYMGWGFICIGSFASAGVMSPFINAYTFKVPPMSHLHFDMCGMFRFVLCRWSEMLPLRYLPSSPDAMSAYVRRFGAAADIKMTTRDLRTGMVFSRVKVSQIDEYKPENSVHIALSGQWSPDATTYKCDYLHPAFFNALFSHVVRAVVQRVMNLQSNAVLAANRPKPSHAMFSNCWCNL